MLHTTFAIGDTSERFLWKIFQEFYCFLLEMEKSASCLENEIFFLQKYGTDLKKFAEKYGIEFTDKQKIFMHMKNLLSYRPSLTNF